MINSPRRPQPLVPGSKDGEPMLLDLTGRIGLVTGASRGIGAAIALALAGAGADVAINYREQALVAERVAASVNAIGPRAISSAGRCVRQ
jgi:NAD(P)-dependent dehydrogenase (short-subunit alcohol dehydrogenase family)